jgi:putative spermidine/putrescine transport system ATP-binding protein
VSIDIAPGEFMTFLGPSGSGKTTTLNAIAGFLDVTSGRVLLDGEEVTDVKPHKRDLGMVFQHYALFPHMTVTQNIAFPLAQRKMPKALIREKVAEALELVHLAELADRYPRQLSGGQQQRVALARAVVFSPRALLLDEPLGALDRKLRQVLQAEIRRMHTELGLTFVFVTHDQEEALALSDRIAVFNEGKIEQVGSPDVLYDQPATLFVATFLGESNVFRGVLDRSARTFCWRDRSWPVADDVTAVGEVALVVRPERVTVTSGPTPTTGDATCTAPAEVVADVFLGVHRRIELRFADGTAGSAVLPSGSPTPPFAPGTPVTAGWRAEDQRLVATGTPAPAAEEPRPVLVRAGERTAG